MSQENKNNNEKKEQPKEDLDIDNLINQFEEGQLNLTNEQKKQGEQQEDAEVMKKIKDEYEKFMKEMQGGEQADGDLGAGGLGKAFEELLTGLGDEDGTGHKIGQQFEKMFSNLESPQNFEKAAADLLNQFMDKSLLEQPLKQTKMNYQTYIKQVQDKGQDVPTQYKQQYQIVCDLVETLEKDPNNKPKMIDMFSKLQEKGTPPEGIAPSFGFF